VCNALFSGMLFGFAAVGALACQPQVDDFSHAKAQRLLSARSVPWRSPLQCRIPVNCADKVARITVRTRTMCEIAHPGTHLGLIFFCSEAICASRCKRRWCAVKRMLGLCHNLKFHCRQKRLAQDAASQPKRNGRGISILSRKRPHGS
jgi:hypothetical protein